MTDPPGTDHLPVVVELLSLVRELWRLRFLDHHATSEVFSRLRAIKAVCVLSVAGKEGTSFFFVVLGIHGHPGTHAVSPRGISG